jgi:malonyl CoA-acyl carrier protein transacylase
MEFSAENKEIPDMTSALPSQDDGMRSVPAAVTAMQQELQLHGMYLGTPTAELRTCAMFPGHGSEYPDMLAGLAAAYPVAGETLDRIDATYERLTGHSLTSRMSGEKAAQYSQDPEILQPAIFAASIALYRVMEASGVEPEVLIGHSVGEFSALTASGALSLEDGVVAVHGRGVAVKTVAPERRGTMLAVNTSGPETGHALQRLLVLANASDGYVTRSLVNSPEQSVLSGDVDAIEAMAARCKEAGIKTVQLHLSHGFHSNLLTSAVPVLERTLRTLTWNTPRIPVLSTVFGDFYRGGDVPRIPALLARGLVTPFSFQDLILQIRNRGVRVFVEVGPKSTLSGLVKRILAGGDALVVPMNVPSVGPVPSIHRFRTFVEVHRLARQRAATQAPPAGPAATQESATGEAGVTLKELLRIVSHHTGYPLALLGIDQRMGADLGFNQRVRGDIVRVIGESSGVRVDAITTDGHTTLGGLLAQLATLGSTVEPVEPATQAPVTEQLPTSVAAAATDRDPAEVTGVVLEEVQAKTGYPPELLELDLELEADLGIDSVKQADILGSVRDHYGISPDIEFDLAEINTLRKVIAFVAGVVGAGQAAAPKSRPATHLDLSEVTGVVLEEVQAKTGYPPELLELDLELEADLGIDSVKQADILGSVRDHYGISPDIEFDLAEINTLRKVIAFVAGIVGADGTVRTDQTADAAPAAGVQAGTKETPPVPAHDPVLHRDLDRVTQRYVPVVTERPLVPGTAPPFAVAGKAVVVIADRDGQVCEALLPLLARAQARVHVVNVPATGLAAAFTAARADLGSVQLVINLYPYQGETAGSTLDAPPEHWTTEVDTRFSVDLLAAQAFYPDLAKAGPDGGYFAATTVGGSFGVEAMGDLDPLGGLTAGFVKSLALELPGLVARVVDFTDGQPTVVAQALFDEIVTGSEPNVEVSYIGGTRKVLLVMPHELELNQLQGPLRLSRDDVLVVSGGSRGITYECVKELVAAYGVTMVILGRAALPDGTEDWLTLDDEEFAAYRPEFLRQSRRDHPTLTPVAADAEFTKLANRRTVYRNLEALRAFNSRVDYEVCDVADGEQVRLALHRVRQRHGRITGVIHGAGVQSISRVTGKRIDQALELVRIKTNGAYYLWHAVKEDQPRFFVLVGSVLGRCGMDGQVDYTAAADVMPKISAQLARANPLMRSFTIAWTAWADTGMAASESVRRVQEEQRGVRFVGVEEGVQTLVRELSYGGDDPETLVFGDTGTNSWGGMDAALDKQRRRIATVVGPSGHINDRLNHPLIDEVRHRDGTTVWATKRLRADIDLYLPDHAVRGVGTFPGTLHVEAQAEAASLLCPDLALVAAEDIEFLRYIKDNPKFPLTLDLRAGVSTTEGDRRKVSAEIRSDLVGSAGHLLEAGRLHSTGYYWFAEQAAIPPEPDVSVPQLLTHAEPIDLDSLYQRTSKHLAFGPAFRHVLAAWSVGDGETVSEIRVPDTRGMFSFATSPQFRTMPIVIDNALRASMLWMYQDSGQFRVPVSIGLMRFFRSPLPTERLHAFSRVTKTEESGADRVHADVQITDASGALLCDIRDLVVTSIGSDAITAQKGRDVANR